jgi:hypothetical protein
VKLMLHQIYIVLSRPTRHAQRCQQRLLNHPMFASVPFVGASNWASKQLIPHASVSHTYMSLLYAGKQRVYDNGRLHWPNGRFGLCGDAYDAQVRKNERPGHITGRLGC